MEGLKATSPTARPYRHATICGEEGQCATSSSNLGEGFTTTSSTVKGIDIQRVAKYPMCENVSVAEGLKATSLTAMPYSHGTIIGEECQCATSSPKLGEGFMTTSSTVEGSDIQIVLEKEDHRATSSTSSPTTDYSGTSFSHASIINILPNEKPRDAYFRYVEVYHNLPSHIMKLY